MVDVSKFIFGDGMSQTIRNYLLRLVGFLLVLLSISKANFEDELFPYGVIAIIIALAIAIALTLINHKKSLQRERVYYIGIALLVLAKFHDILQIGSIYTNGKLNKTRKDVVFIVGILALILAIWYVNSE